MPIKEDPKALWEILVPCQYNDGTPVTTKHHKEWDRKVMMVSGGLTILKPVTGQWSFGGKVYRDRNIPVRILGTDADISKIIGMTMMHYEQLAIIAYTISERAQVFETPQGMVDNFFFERDQMASEDVKTAAAEALTYNRMGGVTKEMIEDICFDHKVDMGDVLEEMEWGRDHYDNVS